MMTKIFRWPYLAIFLAAILLRLLVMPFYFHPDLKTYTFQVSFLGQGVGNIYQYLIANRASLPLKEEFVYFPLTYFSLGLYQWLISPLLGSGFGHWLADASQSAVIQVGVYRYLFLLKLPYLVMDLLIGAMLMSWGQSVAEKRRILSLWLLNPFSLAIIYVYSNIDVLIVGMTVASLWWARRGKWWLAALMLGLGAGFKAYPLLLLPFLMLAVEGWRRRLMIGVVGLGSFLIVIGPFLRSVDFRQATLVSGLTTRLFFPSLGLGFQEFLMPGVIGIGVLGFLALTRKVSVERLGWWWGAALLLIFGTIHYHIAWLLWVGPWLVLWVYAKPRLLWPVVIWTGLAMLIPMLYDDKFMTWGTLGVIEPIYLSLPTLFIGVSQVFDPYVLIGVLHSLLLAGAVVLSWEYGRIND